MKLYKCPKFATCSAPICPLDPDFLSRTCRPDEKVCPFQIKLAAGKPLNNPEELIEVIVEVTPKAREAFPRVDRQMCRAYKNRKVDL